MPVYNNPEALHRRAIESVLAQHYPHWELCLAVDAATPPHVRATLTKYGQQDERIKIVCCDQVGSVAEQSNSALALATGDYVGFMGDGDVLAEQALYLVALELDAWPTADLVYADDDEIDDDGRRHSPFFKPDWNPDLFFSCNYLRHLTVLRASLVRAVCGFRPGYAEGEAYDLYLRAIARTAPECIRHIPHVLYHCRSTHDVPGGAVAAAQLKDAAGRAALEDYFRASGEAVPVEPGLVPGTFRCRYHLPATPPLVSLIIPTRDGVRLLKKSIGSILKKTTYPNFEIIVVDNQSRDRATLAYLQRLQRQGQIRVLPYDAPFNYSAINNFAVAQARGDIIGLINNDVEVISPDWLTELVANVLRPGVGAVGAKLYYPDGRIQHGGVILGLGGVACHANRFVSGKMPGYMNRLVVTQNFSAVTAACLVVRKQVFDEVGGLNETELVVAFNDVDLCLKIRHAGYRNVWTPYAELYHHESVSRGVDDTPEKLARVESEMHYLLEQWGEIISDDPAYNPNLALDAADFRVAWLPRVDYPWRQTSRRGLWASGGLLPGAW